MLTTLLKCKLHMACVTHAELWYDGSCGIDSNLVGLAGLREFEKIEIYNITNGERYCTYVILEEPGSGIISMNGAAARKAQVSDRVIIAAYGEFDEGEIENFEPNLIYLNENNKVERTLHMSHCKTS